MSEFQEIKLWQRHDGKIKMTNEFGLPEGNSDTTPEVGAGAKRWNSTTLTEQIWNGTVWVDSNVTNVTFSNNDDFEI